jgi:signal transduction histidine kinase
VTAILADQGSATKLQGNVLVVDDDFGLQSTLCDILTLVGLNASGVGSASEATRWCDNQTPDLVVLDQRLPDASGLQLAALLRARLPLVPIVLLTGYVSAESAIAAVGMVDDYLTKPVPPAELIKVVQTRLEQHRLRAANQALVAQLGEANTRLELTVQERTRELREARDQAMEASRLKSQFLATMSHEIRTPMNGVIGAADLLATTALSAEQKGYVDILSASGHSLLAVINDILDFSKIEAGQLDLAHSPFVLREQFADVVRMLAPQAARKDLRLTFTAEPDLPESVVGDAIRLRQVVTNLVGNAVKFTDFGHVAVTLSVLTRQPESVTVRCAVTDSGIGIAARDVPRLFSDFSQVDQSNSRRFGGTGLGLAISDRLVGLMGGQIGYLPNRSGGSTFWFTVRFEQSEEPLAEGLSATDVMGAETTESAAEVPSAPLILIVEDNDTNATILARMLTIVGYRSDTVPGGAAALEAVENASYAAILLDCQMPVMDGFTTARLLRERADGAPYPPIVAITATATTEDHERCLAAGMQDYLPKPIVMERLAAVLSRWVPAAHVGAAGQ